MSARLKAARVVGWLRWGALMSESVLPQIDAFNAGKIGWPELREYLVAHDWSTRSGNDPKARKFGSAWYNDVEANIGLPPVPGTWDEFTRAFDQGLISRPHYTEVLQAVYEAAKARAAVPPPIRA